MDWATARAQHYFHIATDPAYRLQERLATLEAEGEPSNCSLFSPPAIPPTSFEPPYPRRVTVKVEGHSFTPDDWHKLSQLMADIQYIKAEFRRQERRQPDLESYITKIQNYKGTELQITSGEDTK